MLQRFSAFFIGALLIAILIQSCSKLREQSPAVQKAKASPEDLTRLQQWFTNQWRVTDASAARVSSWEHDTNFLANNYRNLQLDWRFTNVSYQGTTRYTEVPASLPDSLEFKLGVSDSLLLFQLLSEGDYSTRIQSKILWVVKEVPGQDPYAEIVTFVGEYEYTKANYQRFLSGVSYVDLTGFTGIVNYHDRFGRLLRTAQYERGAIVNIVRCGTEIGLDPAPNRAQAPACYEVLTWERTCVTYFDQYGVGERVCSDWVLVGSYLTGNCYEELGGGGGTSGGDYSPNKEDGLDCRSFAFQSTASNWQEAGVRNVRLNIVWLGGSRHGERISVTLGAPIVYGLPIDRTGGQHYSPGRAAEIAAEAHRLAEQMVYAHLKNSPTRPSDAQIEDLFRRWVHNFMVNYGGTAGRTGSRSPLIVFKDAQYTFLGNGNCD